MYILKYGIYIDFNCLDEEIYKAHTFMISPGLCIWAHRSIFHELISIHSRFVISTSYIWPAVTRTDQMCRFLSFRPLQSWVIEPETWKRTDSRIWPVVATASLESVVWGADVWGEAHVGYMYINTDRPTHFVVSPSSKNHSWLTVWLFTTHIHSKPFSANSVQLASLRKGRLRSYSAC